MKFRIAILILFAVVAYVFVPRLFVPLPQVEPTIPRRQHVSIGSLFKQRSKPKPTPTVVVETEPAPIEVQRFETVEAYFAASNPNPLSHRLGLPNYERDVSRRLRADVLQRDQSCLVCGSTYRLECDHRIALMNGGSNEITNLGTLCDSCHTEKTRYDWAIQRRRRKELEKR